MRRSVVVTLHADRHRDDQRAFAESVQVDVPDAALADVLRATADHLDVAEHARVTLTISEPFA